ncbi:hypothetical protein TNIN_17871 [Trichonephila inaurata madagascariensis]|uniref:Uncharacterized protein n=1 Tax=Trichonephila inaurata madagascariensis TaxID=2747483 RepID=A0A8X7BSD5_9ARAC|nr:hypothetical protein TNIN_17871 [Trichonephila inaurata madagascariensis]
MLLESRKNQLLKRLKENNVDFKRINNVHKRIQNRIEKEKRRGEDNSKRYKEELNKLQTTLIADNETFEIFKKNLLNRELLIDDVKILLTDGIKNYINRDQKEEEESEVSNATEETDTSETTPQSQVSTEENSGKKENEAETEAPVEKKPAKKKAPEKATPIENELSVELQKRKLLHQIAQAENALLTKYYQYLNSRCTLKILDTGRDDSTTLTKLPHNATRGLKWQLNLTSAAPINLQYFFPWSQD